MTSAGTQKSELCWQRRAFVDNGQVAIGSLCFAYSCTLCKSLITWSLCLLCLHFSLIPIYPISTHHASHTLVKMAESPEEISMVTYEQLAAIEDEFEDIDTQISMFEASKVQSVE